MTAREEQEDEERISFLGTNDHDDLSISGRSSHHQRHNKSKTPSSNVVASSTIPSTVAATSLSRKGFIVAATVVFVTVCVAKYSSTNYTSTNAMIDTVEKPPLVPTPPPTPTATPPSADDETSSSSRTTTNDATDASPEVPNSDSASRSSAGTGTSNGKTKKKNSSLKPPEKNTPTDSKPAAAVTADAEQVLYPVPLDNESLSKGFKKMTAQLSDVYLRRGKALSVEAQQAITNQWGEWNFVAPQSPPPKDRDAQQQSQQDEFQSLVESYSNGDIPRSVLVSSNGWQTDPAYLAEWLPQALALVERSMEAMLGEYGHSKFDQPDKDLTERSFMFRVDGFAKQGYSIKHPPGNGGYSTPATLKAIQKRLLHAVMTQGTFVFVMGGHSAAAGHGNHFQQSYTLQVQRVLEPVLARLGVYHKSHNYGVGGMGTLQNGLASADLYGPRMDILLWDCGMTEGDETVKDLFARTGLLTGETVPVLWGDPDGCRYDQQAVPGIGCIQTTFYGKSMV